MLSGPCWLRPPVGEGGEKVSEYGREMERIWNVLVAFVLSFAVLAMFAEIDGISPPTSLSQVLDNR